MSAASQPHFRPCSSRNICRASSASLSEDEDAITPVPTPERSTTTADSSMLSPGLHRHHHTHRRPVSSASSNADVPHLDLSGAGSESDPDEEGIGSGCTDGWTATARLDSLSLWRRMLAVQRVFHCYNSARISAALEDEGMQSRVPSRACLDLLNDSISQMPEDEREQVRHFIEHGEMKKPRKRRSVWRRSLEGNYWSVHLHW